MARKYFGTDGIRGQVNKLPMTTEISLKLAIAVGKYFQTENGCNVVIGRDTRSSGIMIENILSSGLNATGANVVLLGEVPTPAVSVITRDTNANLGIMISASHNPYQDNGIKLFKSDGYKLSDKDEEAIESLMDNITDDCFASADKLGSNTYDTESIDNYVNNIHKSLSGNFNFRKLRIVLDCANGAAYKIAPQILSEAGADLKIIGAEPNGVNINDGCGSTCPDLLAEEVKKYNAHIGIALDGDADRLIICDENGDVVDGDQIIAAIATYMQGKGTLNNNHVIVTQMSNMGLEKYLSSLNIKMKRTAVGDRYVIEEMLAGNYNIGGEQSGHIILSDYATTGDGLLAAIQVLNMLVETGKKASEMLNIFPKMPQKLHNIRYNKVDPLTKPEVQDNILKNENIIGDRGRVFIRKSGTEPLIRVMVEAETKELVDAAVNDIAKTIQSAIDAS